ncbi:MAG: hypothetical protein A7315_09835 [Candidatus Altiarchaeales archaeon WOR_SM1_79]|nr:MAG: hypothetical protein A7315_09835 [Candidatus Altiarchaeales archaeon WOR_SM1_79]
MEWITMIGLLAAACTTLAFLPQAIKALRTKQTRDLSLPTYLVLTIGLFLWLVYGLLISNLPIIMANGISSIIGVIIIALKIKYG